LAALPLGKRDARLLRLREKIFGGRVPCFAQCPACVTPLELELSVEELCERDAAACHAEGPEEDEELHWRGYTLRFRLPNSLDLLAVEGLARVHPGRALEQLIKRCIRSAVQAASEVSIGALPSDLIDEMAAKMAARDPLSEVLVDLRCPECQHAWQGQLDIASYFFKEIEVRARRLLLDVHILARAYGWSAPTVLSLSRRQRQFFLQLVGT
jgi:hypothetical protein